MSSNKGRNSTQKKKLRQKLLRGRTSASCCFCQRPMPASNATLEHIIPLSHGGGWEADNLRLSCASCNEERGVEDFEQFQKSKRADIKKLLADHAASQARDQDLPHPA